MGYKIIRNENASHFNKNGVDFTGYEDFGMDLGIVIENVEKGHFEEFVHEKSTFIYIFLEGKGVFVLNDEEVSVKAGDILIIEPGTRIYYYGSLKQILITSPKWDAAYERHIRILAEDELRNL